MSAATACRYTSSTSKSSAASTRTSRLRYADAYARLHFLDAKSYRSRFLAGEHDIYIYSPLMSMTQALHRYRETDWVVPYGDFLTDITDEAIWPGLTISKQTLPREFLEWFRDNFTFEGGLTEADYREHLHWLCRTVSVDKQLILLNGAEIDLDHEWEPGASPPLSDERRAVRSRRGLRARRSVRRPRFRAHGRRRGGQYPPLSARCLLPDRRPAARADRPRWQTDRGGVADRLRRPLVYALSVGRQTIAAAVKQIRGSQPSQPAKQRGAG